MRIVKMASLLLGTVLLVACSSSLEKQTKPAASQTTQTTQPVESSTQQPSAETETVSYNGSYYTVQGKYGEVVIVNKKHPVAKDYNPGEDPTAVAAFHELLADMQAQGLDVSDQYSGFRSYDTQTELYNSYVAADGQENADHYSARPGYSEHQTGLAYDLLDNAGNLLEDSTAVAWLRDNAHKYGFVVRYLADKEDITGYVGETWHVRYIGKEATDIYHSGLTVEEYYGIEGGDYKD